MSSQKRGKHVAAIVEMNKLTRYAVSPEHPETTTFDSRQAYAFESEEAACAWCQQHPEFSYVYQWSVGS